MVAAAYKRKPALLRGVLRHGQPQGEIPEAALQRQLESQIGLHSGLRSVPGRPAGTGVGVEAALLFPAFNAVLQHFHIVVTQEPQGEHGLSGQ